MGVIIELCKGSEKKTRNTGANEQCFEGILERPFVAKKGFEFATIAEFKSLIAWRAAIAAKNVVPLFDAYEVTAANTEATNFESGNFTYETAPAVKKTQFECFLGFCSHRALKSYKNSEYTQIFEFTKGNGLMGVDAGLGKVKGQELSNINVGIRNIATKDKPAFTQVIFTYKDYNELEDNPVAVIPSWDTSDVPGIFDVNLEIVSASATQIKFKALSGCGNDLLTSLVAADVVLRNATGVVQTVSFVVADANGVYTLTGTAFATGYVLNLNGVVIKTNFMYESQEPLVVNF